jgi:hypothetical protein
MVSDVGHIDEKVFQEYYAQAAKLKVLQVHSDNHS